MKFNKAQREGIANIFGNVGTVAILGGIAGRLYLDNFSTAGAVYFVVSGIALIAMSMRLRRSHDKEAN
ncbi:hypothetical protein [Pseudogulbenkiania subflava]|uniref:Uncharacterized protein n=1 Tax=Pseudogulbenkiania subflava DSM 22618 TaxID=1123014 RepID=A0A1Y6C6Q8_9NEIS|nr:hypothetical protein [Pseudogulbenkiania subflava]SMF39988.1 hypothetical protein SAMN02745746_03010 [Pseudogulbenkiania subflava DSM 22618]